MNGLTFVAYGVGGLLSADAIGNLNTTGHNWQIELFIGITALFIGGMTHLINKARGN